MDQHQDQPPPPPYTAHSSLNSLSGQGNADYLKTLNDQQRAAVETTQGAVLVLAGAGTGKTRVLTTRLAHILRQNLARPAQILAVTFTNKAAQEMRERVAAMLDGASVDHWWLGTFHALATRMLRRHADLAGLTSQFTIIDMDDQNRLIKQIMEELSINSKKNAPKVAANIISKWKDRALSPQQLENESPGSFADGKMKILYTRYQQRLKDINACDFGDLLMHIIHILQDPKNSAILHEYHARFQYIMVDEYQDTNVAQYLWLRLLAQGNSNICCVGDDDQSIYGWRGAELGNILRFEQDFPGAKTIRLEQNYRSTNRILKAAGGMINANKNRLGKTLWSEQGEGEKIIIRGLWDGPAEARWVCEQIELQQRQKEVPLNQIAILVRAGFQMREFEERFIQLGLPYKVFGGPRFYERAEIRDALAYLRLVAQPKDDLALERIINLPKRGIGTATIQIIHKHARSRGVSLYQAIQEVIDTDELRPKMRETLRLFIQNFETWRGDLYQLLDQDRYFQTNQYQPQDLDLAAPHGGQIDMLGASNSAPSATLSGQESSTSQHADPHVDPHVDQMRYIRLANKILEESGYLAMWSQAKTLDAPGRVENLKEFTSAIGQFDTLPDFLEHVSLVLDNMESHSQERISLMTLHAAKGLEFDCVFLPGWEEGLFPSQRSLDENGLKALEEERRLAYVGITRARKRAFISYVGSRQMYGNWINALPSRFIEELPGEEIDVSSDIASYNTSSYGSSDSPFGGASSRSFGNESYGRSYSSNSQSYSSEPKQRHSSGNARGFKPQSRVRHASFGEGSVIHVDGHKLDIAFDNGSQKRVMDSFVELLD